MLRRLAAAAVRWLNTPAGVPADEWSCPGCCHLFAVHGAKGCEANVYHRHSLDSDPCPCPVRNLPAVAR